MIYDLTHPVEQGMPVWPGDRMVEIEQIKFHREDGYAVHSISISTHTGTHLDSPYHRISGGQHVDSMYILERVVGEALIINAGKHVKNLIITFDTANQIVANIESGAKVLFSTGWSKFWGKENYYSDFPSISPELATYLAGKNISLLGTDSPSVDRPGEDTVHDILLSAGIPLIENLNNLHVLGSGYVFFSAAPLRLAAMDGSPVRAYAIKQG